MTRDEQERLDAIRSDVPYLREERRVFIIAMEQATDPMVIAILQRRVDKIEERFDEIGLREDGSAK